MHKKYCLTNKSNVVTYSSQIRPVLDLSSKTFSKVSSPRQLRRGTSICPAVLKSLSTGADEGRVHGVVFNESISDFQLSVQHLKASVRVSQVARTFLFNAVCSQSAAGVSPKAKKSSSVES